MGKHLYIKLSKKIGLPVRVEKEHTTDSEESIEGTKVVIDRKNTVTIDINKKMPIRLKKEYNTEIQKKRMDKILDDGIPIKNKYGDSIEEDEPPKEITDVTRRGFTEFIENSTGIEPEEYYNFLKGGNSINVYSNSVVINGYKVVLGTKDYLLFKLLCENTKYGKGKDYGDGKIYYTKWDDIFENELKVKGILDEDNNVKKIEVNIAQQIHRLKEKLKHIPLYETTVLPMDMIQKKYIENKAKKENFEKIKRKKRNYMNKKRKGTERIEDKNIIITLPKFGYMVSAEPYNIQIIDDVSKV